MFHVGEKYEVNPLTNEKVIRRKQNFSPDGFHKSMRRNFLRNIRLKMKQIEPCLINLILPYIKVPLMRLPIKLTKCGLNSMLVLIERPKYYETMFGTKHV